MIRLMVGALLIAGMAFSMLGCTVFNTPVVPYLGGSGFNDTYAPVDTTFDRTTIGDRVGRASSCGILGLFSFGDCSTQAAARNGNITQIDQIDCRIFHVLAIYVKYETIVSGTGE